MPVDVVPGPCSHRATHRRVASRTPRRGLAALLSLALIVLGVGVAAPARADFRFQNLEYDTQVAVPVPASSSITFTVVGVPGRRLGITLGASGYANPLALSMTVNGPGVAARLRLGANTPAPVMDVGAYNIQVSTPSQAGTITALVQAVEDVTGTLPLGGEETIDFTTVFTQYSKTFDQVPGARLRFDVVSSNLRATGGQPWPTYIGVYDDEGDPGRVASAAMLTRGATFSTVFPHQMSGTGPRTISMRSDGLTLGTVTVRWSLVFDYPTEAATLGTPVPMTFDAAFRRHRYTLDTTGVEEVHVAVTDVALTGTTGTPGVIFVNNDTGSAQFAGELVDVRAGTSWTVIVDARAATGTATLRLDAMRDVRMTGTLGSPIHVTIPSFTARVVIDMPARTGLVPDGVIDAYDVQDATGAGVTRTLRYDQAGVFSREQPLSAADIGGTFAAPGEIDPAQPWQVVIPVGPGVVGSLSITLREPTTTRLDAAPTSSTPVSFAVWHDQTDIWFTPTPGRGVIAELIDATTSVSIEAYTPAGDGAPESPIVGGWDGSLDILRSTSDPVIIRVALTGEWWTGRLTRPGTASVRLTEVTNPQFRFGTTASTVAWTRAQNPVGTVVGQKGKRVVLDVKDALWVPWDQPVVATLYGPDGAALADARIDASGLDLVELGTPLPTSGTYRLGFDPQGPSSGSMGVTVRQIADITRTTGSGAPATLAFTEPGQRASVSIKVPQGQQLDWALTAPAGMTGQLTLLGPTGDTLAGAWFDAPGTFATDPLPAGTYRVVVDPEGRGTGTVKLTLTTRTP